MAIFGRRKSEPPRPVNPFLEPSPAPEKPAVAEKPALPPRPAGRPAAGERKRSHRIGLSVSEGEQEVWTAAAERDGYTSLARWCRDAIASRVAAAGETRESAAAGAEIARLRADLGRVGANLNQVARELNTAAKTDGERPSVAEVQLAITGVRVELGRVRAWTVEQR